MKFSSLLTKVNFFARKRIEALVQISKKNNKNKEKVTSWKGLRCLIGLGSD